MNDGDAEGLKSRFVHRGVDERVKVRQDDEFLKAYATRAASPRSSASVNWSKRTNGHRCEVHAGSTFGGFRESRPSGGHAHPCRWLSAGRRGGLPTGDEGAIGVFGGTVALSHPG